MDDSISKASVCEILADIYPTDGERVVPLERINKAYESILSLPSAQPVLTCKGCKYDYYEYAGCRNCLRRERDLYEPE